MAECRHLYALRSIRGNAPNSYVFLEGTILSAQYAVDLIVR